MYLYSWCSTQKTPNIFQKKSTILEISRKIKKSWPLPNKLSRIIIFVYLNFQCPLFFCLCILGMFIVIFCNVCVFLMLHLKSMKNQRYSPKESKNNSKSPNLALAKQILEKYRFTFDFRFLEFQYFFVFFVFPFGLVMVICVEHQEYMHIAIVLVLFLLNILYVSDNESTPKIPKPRVNI